MAVELIWNLPPSEVEAVSPLTCVFTHGAGAPATSDAMTAIAQQVAQRGIAVARFNFPYMQRAQESGRRAWPPDPEDVLVATWVEVMQQFVAKGAPVSRLVIGGRSMGGRIASAIADAAEVAALIPISYPFHAPRDPSRASTTHLQTIATPTLIVQGERDEYGSREEVESYHLSPNIKLHWIRDGDHGLKPRKRSGRTESDNFTDAANAIADYIHNLK